MIGFTFMDFGQSAKRMDNAYNFARQWEDLEPVVKSAPDQVAERAGGE